MSNYFKNPNLFRVLGYTFVISFGVIGISLPKETFGDLGQYIILIGLPLAVVCIYNAYRLKKREEQKV